MSKTATRDYHADDMVKLGEDVYFQSSAMTIRDYFMGEVYVPKRGADGGTTYEIMSMFQFDRRKRIDAAVRRAEAITQPFGIYGVYHHYINENGCCECDWCCDFYKAVRDRFFMEGRHWA